MEDLEFLEPHATCGFGGQQWPIYQDYPDRDDVIAEHINATKEELGDE
jgi:hypothetical protein